MMPRKLPLLFSVFGLAAFLLVACRPATETLLMETIPTKTQIPPSNTPKPTASATLEPTLTATSLATPAPSTQPTNTPDLAITAEYQSTLEAGEALVRIGGVLASYGFSTENGSLGWLGSEPLKLSVQNFGTIIYEPVAERQEFDNFVLHVDIAWESTSGLAGCGIIFRSEPDLQDGNQYMLRTLHLSGQPGWAVEHWDSGAIRTTLRAEPNAAILIGPGTLNNFTMVLQGTIMTLYANGTRLTGLTINQRSTGLIAFLAWQESGVTTCLYENAWIWELSD